MANSASSQQQIRSSVSADWSANQQCYRRSRASTARSEANISPRSAHPKQQSATVSQRKRARRPRSRSCSPAARGRRRPPTTSRPTTPPRARTLRAIHFPPGRRPPSRHPTASRRRYRICRQRRRNSCCRWQTRRQPPFGKPFRGSHCSALVRAIRQRPAVSRGWR